MLANGLPRRSRSAAVQLLVPCLAVLACRGSTELTWAACARIQSAAVDECSGIVESRRFPGVLWVHNDSGDEARFFGIDARGDLLVEVGVDGATNVDWEDIAVDDSGQIYLADSGNNRNKRRDLVIYVVDEPDPRGSGAKLRIPVRRRLPFHYPDQQAFPDSSHFNFDCEAIYFWGGKLYLLTKHRSDLKTTLYRLDPQRTGEQVAERLGETEIGSPVTAADCSPDGKLLAVLSYQYIHLFERQSTGDDFLTGRSHRTLIEGRQCEALCFDGDRVLYTNEQREIYCVPIRYLWEHDHYIPEPPQVDLPRVEPRLDGLAGEWSGDAGRLVFDRYIEIDAPPKAGKAPTSSAPGAPEGAQLATRVTVRAGWCPDGILLQVQEPARLDASTCERRGTDGEPTAFLMLGAKGAKRPCLEATHGLWAIVEEHGALVLREWSPEDGQPRCAPAAAGAAPRFAAGPGGSSMRQMEALLPVPTLARLAPGMELALDVLLVIPGCAADVELGWSASRDMQPLGNPLLWGKARLGTGVAQPAAH